MKKGQVSIAQLQREIDACMQYYMLEETRGKEKTLSFQQSYAEVVQAEKELVMLKKEEVLRYARQCDAIGLARDFWLTGCWIYFCFCPVFTQGAQHPRA